MASGLALATPPWLTVAFCLSSPALTQRLQWSSWEVGPMPSRCGWGSLPPTHVFPVLSFPCFSNPSTRGALWGRRGGSVVPPPHAPQLFLWVSWTRPEYCPGVSLPQSQPLTVPYKPPGLLAGPCRNLRVFSSSPFPCPWPLISGASAQSCCGSWEDGVFLSLTPRWLRLLPVPPSTEVSGQLGVLPRRQREVCEAQALPHGGQP